MDLIFEPSSSPEENSGKLNLVSVWICNVAQFPRYNFPEFPFGYYNKTRTLFHIFFHIDLLDVSWSKNYFILSSSMDKTVRLWHISRRECLCCFQHIDFVTAIAFHPRDDRYFLSGSLDGKLRLWNIPDKKVALWNEVDGQTKLITAANFCQNGKFAVVGSYDGRCIFYNTDQLKYHTQIHVRSTRGRNKTGRKISGIEPMPGEDKILVTSNDSRVRLYDLRDLNLSCKYKGYLNISSQIKASFSHDGKFIIAGSENQCIYIWKTNHDYSKLSSVSTYNMGIWYKSTGWTNKAGIAGSSFYKKNSSGSLLTCGLLTFEIPKPRLLFTVIYLKSLWDLFRVNPVLFVQPLYRLRFWTSVIHFLVYLSTLATLQVYFWELVML